MNSYKPLHGVIVPIVTPFNNKNQIDFSALQKVLDFLLSKEVHALMVGGTTGEGMLLSVNERKELLESTVNYVDKKIPVIAHTGCIDTESTVELTKHANQAGADFVSAIVPFFFTLDDNQIFQHFMKVSEAAQPLPMLLYTFPGNAKNDISPNLLKRILATGSNIIGIKSSNSNLIRFQDYVNIGGGDFSSCFGVDELMLAGMILGSKAQVSGNANAFPEPFIDLYKAYVLGDIKKAQQLQNMVNSIVEIHHAGLTPAFFKASLKIRGIPAGNVRPPMRELTDEEFAELRRNIIRLNLI